ncbi:MAG TPA: TIGR02597 family protein [Verrucomicrobiales bacterium]|nr:TIGR02597 family protein [Verrucomicrobiales bacterium]
MKHKISLIIGALSLAAAAGSHAQTAVTDPVGYITMKVTAAPAGSSSLSFVAPTLVNKLEFSGIASAATATTITLSGAAPLTAGAYNAAVNAAYDSVVPMPGYYVEVSAGAGEGQWANITGNTATALTVDRDLSTFITGGTTTVRIRKHSTIGEVFGTTNTAGLKGADTSAAADEVKLLKPVTHEVKSYFFYDDGAVTQWSDLNLNDAVNVIIGPDQGMVIQRKNGGAAVNVVRVGHVKTGKTAVYATPGANVLPVTRAVGDNFTLTLSNLQNTGAQNTRIFGADTSAAADLLRIPQANGQLKDFFFYNDGAVTQWSDLNLNDASNEPLNEGEAFVYIRQAAGGNLTWTVPAQPIAP